MTGIRLKCDERIKEDLGWANEVKTRGAEKNGDSVVIARSTLTDLSCLASLGRRGRGLVTGEVVEGKKIYKFTKHSHKVTSLRKSSLQARPYR